MMIGSAVVEGPTMTDLRACGGPCTAFRTGNIGTEVVLTSFSTFPATTFSTTFSGLTSF